MTIIKSEQRHSAKKGPRVNTKTIVPDDRAATVESSTGTRWQVGWPHIDNGDSPKYGITLSKALKAGGHEDLDSGDLVTIETVDKNRRFQLVGRASRKTTAYFFISDLAAAGIAVHQPFQYVIVDIERINAQGASTTQVAA